jgi:hypothetical protein
MINDKLTFKTSDEENYVIAALLNGGITLENAIHIAHLQVEEYGAIPLKPYEITDIETVDMDIWDLIQASDILYAYFGFEEGEDEDENEDENEDEEVIFLTSCLHCGEKIIGNYAQIGQTILYHEAAHLHEARVAKMMKYGEEDNDEEAGE